MILPRKIYLALSLLSLLAGLSIFFFASPGKFLRATGGDFIVVIFLYLALKTLWPRQKALYAGLSVFIFAFCIELLQLLKIRQLIKGGSFADLTIGSTFDPLDILAYAAGLLVVGLIDHFFISPGSLTFGKEDK